MWDWGAGVVQQAQRKFSNTTVFQTALPTANTASTSRRPAPDLTGPLASFPRTVTGSGASFHRGEVNCGGGGGPAQPTLTVWTVQEKEYRLPPLTFSQQSAGEASSLRLTVQLQSQPDTKKTRMGVRRGSLMIHPASPSPTSPLPVIAKSI